MKKIGLSVIIPLYNSKDWIVPTIDHIVDALKSTSFDAEIIVIDDGSSDGGADVARTAKVPKGIKVQIISQKNAGRYLARKRGVELAAKDNILFIDSRVYIDKGSLVFLESKLAKNDDQLWNGHVNIYKKGNIFARFWDAIVCVAWRRYFRKPKTISYGLKDFDYYPKGTGFFYVPKQKLLTAMDYFEKTTNDLRHSSDDTLLIRYLVKRQNIHLSPEFSCLYHGRSTIKTFLTHAYSRGQFFIDGFFRPGTRFFYPLIAVLLGSLVALAALVIWPMVTLQVVGILAVTFILALLVGSLAMGVVAKDAVSLAILGLPFGVVYLVGLWRGVLRKSKVLNKGIEGLVKPRILLRGTVLEYVIVALLFLAVLSVITGGVMLHMNTQVYSDPGDATAGFLWINSSDHTLNPFVSHYDNTNYPFGEDTSGVTLISYFVYWMPMRILSLLFSPIAALNITMFAGYLLSAMAMYLVAKRLTGRKLVAFTAGFAAAFVPYALIKSASHMSYIFGGIFTLIIGCFIAFWQRPGFKKSAALAVLLGVTLYMDGYFILMSIVLALSMIIAGFLHGILSRDPVAEWRARTQYTLISFGFFVLMAAPLLVVTATQGERISTELASNRSDISKEIKEYRSNVVDFITPQSGSLLWQGNKSVDRMIAQKNHRSNGSENTDYIAMTIYTVSAIGVVLLTVRLVLPRHTSIGGISGATLSATSLMFLIAATTIVVSLSFMFSPEVGIRGVTIQLPGSLLIQNDIAYWRVLSRLFVLFNVAIVLWFAMSLWLIVVSITSSKLFKQNIRRVISGIFLVLVLCLIALEYATLFPTRPYDFTKANQTYSWLATQGSIKSIAMLPLVDPLDPRLTDYATAQIVHGKKIVNQKVPGGMRLSNVLSPEFNQETLNFLRARKVDAAIFYSDTGNCSRLELGVTVFTEKTVRYNMQKQKMVDTTLCTLRVAHAEEGVDPVYAVFREGFSPSAGAEDQSDIAFREGGAGDIRLVLDDLTTRYSDTVRFDADLRLMPEVPGATWQVEQDDIVIASGDLSSAQVAHVTATVSGTKDVRVIIKTPGYVMKFAEAYLEQVTMTAVTLVKG